MLISISSVACSVLYAVFAVFLALHSGRRAIVTAFVAGSVSTSLWALALSAAPALEPALGGSLEILDVLRLSAWLVFLGLAVRAGGDVQDRIRGNRFVAASVALVGVMVCLVVNALATPVTDGGRLGTLQPYGHLALAVAGLVMVEALLRRARSEGHGRTRYLVLGIGGVLAFETFKWSQALLFRQVDAQMFALTPAINLLVLPLLGVGAARNRGWAIELNLARRAVVHSATLFVIGAYLLALAITGALLRETGGHWGTSLQALFWFGGALGLAFVWASPSARSALRFQLSRYLFTHRHDYREQWERFAKALSAPAGTASRAPQVLHALADAIGSLWGALWLRDGDAFVLAASQGVPAGAAELLSDGPFVSWVESRRGAVSELGRGVPGGFDWAWIAVPLVREGLVGVVLLSRPRGRQVLHAEDVELLRIAAVHAASALLADQRARRLGEVQRFEEVSRGLAFVAHDLRNVANELTLTLANARTHIASPEFQRDLILSMEDSVQSMQKLLDKVARRRHDVPPAEPADLVPMVVGTVRTRRGGETRLALEHAEGETLPVVCEPERLAAMSGHLIQNAIDAAGANGHVTVRLRRDGDRALVEVEDDGEGMAQAVLSDRLRHPFQSSKPGGFGLGLFECRELALALGGELEMESTPGRGTLARLRLPLAEEALARSR